MSALAPLLQAFFIERLAQQRDASPHTIAAYRDSFRLLLTFVHQHTGTAPSRLQLEDLDADHDHRVPRLPGKRARQQRPHPQRAADRDPLVLPLRGLESPRVR